MYGCFGAENSSAVGAVSTIWPRYITATRSQRYSTVARSCVMKRHEKPRSLLQVAQQVEDRRLHGDVERGDRLVGDEQRRRDRERAREPDALPLPARELVRVAVPQLRPQADRVEQLAHASVDVAARATSRWMRSGSPTISPQVMRGLSDEYGSWKTMCISRRSGRSSRRDACVMSRPLSRIVPAVGSSSRTTQLPTVDLPLPDSPTSPSISPAPIVNDTPSTACTTPPPPNTCEPDVEVLDEVLDLERRDVPSLNSTPDGSTRRGGPAPTSRSGGTSRVRLLVGARAAVGERAGRPRPVERRARGPGSRCSLPFWSALPGRGIAPSRPIVYGCCGSREELVDRRLLDLASGVHDEHAVGDVGDDAEVVRDQDDRRAEPLADVAHQVEDARLDRHVERGRRLVGDEHLRVARERHRDHHALPHAAGELVRVLVDAPRRARGCARGRAARPRAGSPRVASVERCCSSTSAIWRPTRNDGLSDVIGSWKTNAICRPRIRRICLDDAASSSMPSKRARAVDLRASAAAAAGGSSG